MRLLCGAWEVLNSAAVQFALYLLIVFVFQGISQNAGDLVLLGALPTVAMATGAAVLLDAVVDLSRGRAAERVP